MNRKLVVASMSLVCLMIASLALAVTQAQVEADAEALQADYLVLAERVDACPDGECGDVQDIIADAEALESRRATLHADRATLPGSCPCTALDQTIAAIDVLADSIDRTIKGWDEIS